MHEHRLLRLERLDIVQSPLADFKTLLSVGVFSLFSLHFFSISREGGHFYFYETVHSEKEDNIGNKHQMFQAHDL